jgi:hypothetical protein
LSVCKKTGPFGRFFWLGFNFFGLRVEHYRRAGVPNGRKLACCFGLLRNSTIFATQKLGFGQCSQKAPETAEFVDGAVTFSEGQANVARLCHTKSNPAATDPKPQSAWGS